MISRQQRYLFNKVKRLFGGKTQMISNYRPGWMVNPETLNLLEIDIYLPEFKIGIEYQGSLHFGNSKRAKQVQHRDKLKPKIAGYSGVIILRFYQSDLIYEPFGKLFKRRIRQACKPDEAKRIISEIESFQLEHFERFRMRSKVRSIKKESQLMDREFDRKVELA